MFYSETLLSKTGPLARVWLAANIERKLTKREYVQSNIETSVSAIVDQGQAPMALRLSGQLLLGVVRIYSRKARYLLDDCNEALMKIKMAFRPGNVDLPANQSHAANPNTLVLPDVLTELDLLAPMPDPSSLFDRPGDLAAPPGTAQLGSQQDPTLLDWGTSQLLTSSNVEQARAEAGPEATLLEEDIDLGLDIGEDPLASAGALDEPSVEFGRRAAPEREEGFDDTLEPYDGGDLGLDIGDTTGLGRAKSATPGAGLGEEDVTMGGMEDIGPPPFEEEEAQQPQPEEGAAVGPEEGTAEQPERRPSGSPISEIRTSQERGLEQTLFQPEDTTLEPSDLPPPAQQRATKKRKVLPADQATEFTSAQLRAQQADRSRILRDPSFLPRDPILLALQSMSRSGEFVSSVLGDGRARGWAPELRGVLSLEVVRRAATGEMVQAGRKRKRDSGIADVTDEEAPRLELEGEEPESGMAGGPVDLGGDTSLIPAGEEEVIPAAAPGEEEAAAREEEEEEAMSPFGAGADTFDDTTAPLLHPADAGPVAVGTKHAVHLLRDRFGGAEAEPSPGERARRAVLFQDLLPEATATKQEATKLFFEVLVLATKDAIKVEQPKDVLGGPIRIRAKRGLWGSWAEEGGTATQE
ncbi:Rec8 like protein-domain-containing protein, partial [Lineolata rhizophorae]